LAYYIFVPLKITRNGIVVAVGYKALRTVDGAFLTRRLWERLCGQCTIGWRCEITGCNLARKLIAILTLLIVARFKQELL
jgi:hypothetical protein